MIRAQLRLTVPNQEVSRSLVRAVGPDNLRMNRLKAVCSANRQSATFTLTFEGKIETFIFTLDDMLQCLQAAGKTLQAVTEGRRTNVKGD